VLARASCSIAAGSRSATAARRFRPIIRIAAMLIESSSGSLPLLTYDSTACASASAAVAAITEGGAVSTRAGSTRATSGASRGVEPRRPDRLDDGCDDARALDTLVRDEQRVPDAELLQAFAHLLRGPAAVEDARRAVEEVDGVPGHQPAAGASPSA